MGIPLDSEFNSIHSKSLITHVVVIVVVVVVPQPWSNSIHVRSSCLAHVIISGSNYLIPDCFSLGLLRTVEYLVLGPGLLWTGRRHRVVCVLFYPTNAPWMNSWISSWNILIETIRSTLGHNFSQRRKYANHSIPHANILPPNITCLFLKKISSLAHIDSGAHCRGNNMDLYQRRHSLHTALFYTWNTNSRS